MINTDKNKIKELLSRGTEEVIDKKDLEKKLRSGKQLRIKLGIDPTSPNIHIGRSIPLLKLKDFQDLGHKIIFIIGDFTGVIGDTSDKDSERPMLDEKTIKKNIKNYADQAGKIINTKICDVYYNSTWLSKLSYLEISKQANIFSLNEFISRENINKRLSAGKRISLRELLYPLMQGYDSVKTMADVEVGGTDQRFNLLTGREMQRSYNLEPQNIITNPLIEGTDGRKMSSSFGNTINLTDSPNEMFGKIMSIRDELIIRYFTLLTRKDLKEIKILEQEMENGENPRNIKLKLACEIVELYYTAEESIKAEKYFIDTFSKKNTPQEIKTFKPKNYNIIYILTESKLSSSNSEARRLISQGGVKIDNKKITEENFVVTPNSILQKGKLKFLKII